MFKLTLVNGEPINIIVTDLDPRTSSRERTNNRWRRATPDAASVANTLHVLEGIAAEGKAWFQEPRTGHSRNAG
jgi:hypothetical protein